MKIFATPWTAARQAALSFTISWRLLKLMSIESVTPSNLILYHPLFLLPSVFPSIRVFSNESVLHIRWPKYWSSSFSISPSNEYSGLISFRIDWFDLLAVRGTLQSLLQHCFNFLNLKTSFYKVANLLPNTYLQNTSGISSLPLVYITALRHYFHLDNCNKLSE